MKDVQYNLQATTQENVFRGTNSTRNHGKRHHQNEEYHLRIVVVYSEYTLFELTVRSK